MDISKIASEFGKVGGRASAAARRKRGEMEAHMKKMNEARWPKKK